MKTRATGNLGEEIAKKYLVGKGYKILGGQYHAGRLGEIDVVAEKDGHLHFVEVKTRTNRVFGLPEEAITKIKQERITKSVYRYLSENNISHENYQIDCVAIDLDYKTKKAKVRFLESIC
jgi:putative endonuclease